MRLNLFIVFGMTLAICGSARADFPCNSDSPTLLPVGTQFTLSTPVDVGANWPNSRSFGQHKLDKAWADIKNSFSIFAGHLELNFFPSCFFNGIKPSPFNTVVTPRSFTLASAPAAAAGYANELEYKLKDENGQIWTLDCDSLSVQQLKHIKGLSIGYSAPKGCHHDATSAAGSNPNPTVDLAASIKTAPAAAAPQAPAQQSNDGSQTKL